MNTKDPKSVLATWIAFANKKIKGLGRVIRDGEFGYMTEYDVDKRIVDHALDAALDEFGGMNPDINIRKVKGSIMSKKESVTNKMDTQVVINLATQLMNAQVSCGLKKMNFLEAVESIISAEKRIVGNVDIKK